MITNNLDKAIASLNRDDVIALPTETVYGLAGNAFSDSALLKIFKIKQRPLYNPLIVHIKSITDLNKVAVDIPDLAIKLAEKFWPGPLTLVLNKNPKISDLVTAGKNTVAVRVPNHPVALELLGKLDYPLAAPSANPFGSISPTNAQHVFNYFEKSIEIILEGGSCTSGVESTIIGFENNAPILFRHGSISVEDIEQVVGKLNFIVNDDSKPNAPGMLSRHYAPKTQIFQSNNIHASLANHTDKKIGVLLFKDEILTEIPCVQYVLSKHGDLKEATKNLYAYLHQLDQLNLDVIIAELLPQQGLGKTINDRLKRASQK